MVAELFEFVSLPERKTFSRKQLARCLTKFGYFYHLLMRNSEKIRGREDLRQLVNLVDDIEDVCYVNLTDIKPNLDKAYMEYVFEGNEEEARREIMTAMARLRDHLALFAGYY